VTPQRVVQAIAGLLLVACPAWFLVALFAWTPNPHDTELWVGRGVGLGLLSLVGGFVMALVADE
jgi:hypothetical protein